MKKGTIALIALVAIILIWGVSLYNGFVNQDENVKKTWANVEAQYQRRSDLIPNLVNTVKGYAKHEQETFTKVIEARAKATQITIDPENLTPEKMKEYQQTQGEITSALGRLIAVGENYPELKASENFSELQAQLEGTENRINEARRNYNNAVNEYNVKVRRFPANVIAGICGFSQKTPFEAEAGAEKAPEVKF
ncbi:MAG: LemA family protein [Prevotella sp.]|nr:LemA family protein [Candidatus Equicola faecalis]